MDCKKIKEELVFRFADNEMGQELTVAFHRHVEACPGCARRARMVRILQAMLRERLAPTPAPKRLKVRIISAIRGPVH